MHVRSNPFATRYTRPGELDYWFFDSSPSDSGDDHHGELILTAGDSGKKSLSDSRSNAGSYPGPGPLLVNSFSEPADWQTHVIRVGHRLSKVRGNLIIGPHGTGKTTLLHTLRERFATMYEEIAFLKLDGSEQANWYQFAYRRAHNAKCVFSALSKLSQGDLLILDGCEQLDSLSRSLILLKARKRCVTVLATSHRPLRGMNVIYETRLHPMLIKALVAHLLIPVSDEIREKVNSWVEATDLNSVSNLRDFWFELYDLIQPELIPSNTERSSSF